MRYLNIEQNSPEWWAYKVGKISGTRFGQAVSTRENMLVEELADEIMNGECEQSDYVDDDMMFGIENESVAIDLYEQMTGLTFLRGGVMQSDENPDHIASPDAYHPASETLNKNIVIEVKCTRHGKKHLKRFTSGIDTQYLHQVANYFAVDPSLDEVHFLSFCPFRTERPLISIIVTRDDTAIQSTRKTATFGTLASEGRLAVVSVMAQVHETIKKFNDFEF